MTELTAVEGIGAKTAQRIFASRDNFDSQKEIALADQLGVRIINIQDAEYPAALRPIHDPPPVLYVKGRFDRSDALAVAIVGSRRCTTYGREQAGRFAHLLASAGFTIVSGMARGIDTAAHRGALSAKGRTIAVQGCGLNTIFPPENEKLYSLIAQSGACISELPLAYEPLSENFPARNRIIAALSMAVIVIEASARSGALLTVDAALSYNRDVMAIPGRIDSSVNTGSHRIIKQGAKLIDSIEDVMETLGHIGNQIAPHVTEAAGRAEEKAETPLFDPARLNLTDAEKTVYDSLDTEPVHVDEIIEATKLPPGAVNSALISLRLKALIRQLPGNLFTRRRKAK